MGKIKSHFSAEAKELRSAVESFANSAGLRLVKEESNVFGVKILYQNEFAGIEFEFSPRECDGWSAIVGRLSDGSFPAYPQKFDYGLQIQRFDLRDVAAERIERIPELKDRITLRAPLWIDDMLKILDRCCADMLDGDFSLFPKLQLRVMARVPKP